MQVSLYEERHLVECQWSFLTSVWREQEVCIFIGMATSERGSFCLTEAQETVFRFRIFGGEVYQFCWGLHRTLQVALGDPERQRDGRLYLLNDMRRCGEGVVWHCNIQRASPDWDIDGRRLLLISCATASGSLSKLMLLLCAAMEVEDEGVRMAYPSK